MQESKPHGLGGWVQKKTPVTHVGFVHELLGQSWIQIRIEHADSRYQINRLE